ncbi:MAG: hypothetical protein ACHQUC_02100 [Chlamydiales bacterium]
MASFSSGLSPDFLRDLSPSLDSTIESVKKFSPWEIRRDILRKSFGNNLLLRSDEERELRSKVNDVFNEKFEEVKSQLNLLFRYKEKRSQISDRENLAKRISLYESQLTWAINVLVIYSILQRSH